MLGIHKTPFNKEIKYVKRVLRKQVKTKALNSCVDSSTLKLERLKRMKEAWIQRDKELKHLRGARYSSYSAVERVNRILGLIDESNDILKYEARSFHAPLKIDKFYKSF